MDGQPRLLDQMQEQIRLDTTRFAPSVSIARGLRRTAGIGLLRSKRLIQMSQCVAVPLSLLSIRSPRHRQRSPLCNSAMLSAAAKEGPC